MKNLVILEENTYSHYYADGIGSSTATQLSEQYFPVVSNAEEDMHPLVVKKWLIYLEKG
jgi:hypothetical protein